MNLSKTNTLTIHTPEGIEFSLLLAGPVTRFLAWVMDLLIIAAASQIIGMVVGILGIISLDFARAASVMAYFAVSIGYGIVMEWYWYGQTLGKRMLHIRVMDARGLRLKFSQIAIRNLLRFVDSMPVYLVGGLAMLISRRTQRLGDFAANTIVVWHPKISEPDLDQLLTHKYNSLAGYPHLTARLRQRISPNEAGIALQALLRRNTLEPEARIELFREIADHFKESVEFPQEAVEGVSDEQYVRNAVDVLFRQRTEV